MVLPGKSSTDGSNPTLLDNPPVQTEENDQATQDDLALKSKEEKLSGESSGVVVYDDSQIGPASDSPIHFHPLVSRHQGCTDPTTLIQFESTPIHINASTGAAIIEGNLTGLNIGLVSAGVKGNAHGINIGGMAVVRKDANYLINAGLLTDIKGHLRNGVNAGILLAASEQTTNGMNLSVLAAGAKHSTRSINASLFFCGNGEPSSTLEQSLNISGFMAHIGDASYGVNAAIGKASSYNLTAGANIAVWHAENILDLKRGANLALIRADSDTTDHGLVGAIIYASTEKETSYGANAAIIANSGKLYHGITLGGLWAHASGASCAGNLSVIASLCAGPLKNGFNIGGLFSLAGKIDQSLAAGGLIAIAGEIKSGYNLSAIFSINDGMESGLQIGGIYSGHHGCRGPHPISLGRSAVSLGAINHVAGIQEGTAIGLLNLATVNQGLQVGLINYASAGLIEGSPDGGTRDIPGGAMLGLINFVPNRPWYLAEVGYSRCTTNPADPTYLGRAARGVSRGLTRALTGTLRGVKDAILGRRETAQLEERLIGADDTHNGADSSCHGSTLPAVICKVCGDGLTGRKTECPACSTPHHPDCWTYNNGCSTYACAETPKGPPAPTLLERAKAMKDRMGARMRYYLKTIKEPMSW